MNEQELFDQQSNSEQIEEFIPWYDEQLWFEFLESQNYLENCFRKLDLTNFDNEFSTDELI